MITEEKYQALQVGSKYYGYDLAEEQIYTFKVYCMDAFFADDKGRKCMSGKRLGKIEGAKSFSRNEIFETKEDVATFLLEKANAFRKQALELLVDSKVISEEF